MNTKSHEYRKAQSELMKQGKKRCSMCGEIKDIGEFAPKSGRCKPCKSEVQVAWQASPEGQKYYKSYQFEYAIKAHGIDREKYEEMILAQGGSCAICGSTDPGGRGRWQIDHDHKCCPNEKSCGECIRGLLCWNCNYGLGMLKDDPDLLRKAIDYLKAAH